LLLDANIGDVTMRLLEFVQTVLVLGIFPVTKVIVLVVLGMDRKILAMDSIVDDCVDGDASRLEIEEKSMLGDGFSLELGQLLETA